MDWAAGEFLRQSRPFWGRLQAVARKYCARHEDAADLVQETLLRGWRSYSPEAAPTHPRAWLVAIMRNIVIDWHRASVRQVTVVPADHAELTEIAATGLDEPLAPLSGMNEERFREFLDSNVARAFDSLDAPFREVVMLSVVAELTYREIAEVLDCPIGTVMSRMARARRTLREHLASIASSTPRGKEVRL